MILNDWKKNVIYVKSDFSEVSAEESSDISFFHKEEKVNQYITRHILTYKNNGADCEIIPVFQRVLDGVPDFYMMPCVNYNGNEWGTCQEPKGMEQNGEPWIFPADRIAIPSCTIAEFDKATSVIFSDNKGMSVNSSASIFCREGKTVQRIYFSHIDIRFTANVRAATACAFNASSSKEAGISAATTPIRYVSKSICISVFVSTLYTRII